MLIFSLCPIGPDASVVGAGLAPALIQGDRKGCPYTFRVRIYYSSFYFAQFLIYIIKPVKHGGTKNPACRWALRVRHGKAGLA